MDNRFLRIQIASPMDEDVRNYPNLPLYVLTKCNCAFPHNAQPDSGLYGRPCLDLVTRFEHQELLRVARTTREPEAWCELGYRFLTGCAVPLQDYYAALYMFDAVVNRDLAGSRYVGDRAPREVRARAHSGAAAVYLQIWQTPVAQRAALEDRRRRHGRPWPAYEGMGHVAALLEAGMHATKSVQLGLVSDTALKVGRALKDIGFDHLGDDDDDEFAQNPAQPVFDAMTGASQAMLAARRKRDAKRASDPQAYVCAAEGCKVEGVRKGALMACSGTCSPDLKPRYCSKECQKRDWSKHKAVCRARRSGTNASTSTVSRDQQPIGERLRALTVGTGRDGEIGGEWMRGIERAQGPGRLIEITDYPGETIPIVSDTLQPTELRKVRKMLRQHREAYYLGLGGEIELGPGPRV